MFVLGFQLGVLAGNLAPELGHALLRQARRARRRFAFFPLLLELGKAGALDAVALDHLVALEFDGGTQALVPCVDLVRLFVRCLAS